MIDSIRGELVHVGIDHVVIDTGGIAYQIFCPAGTLRACQEGDVDLVHTHLIIRDDAIHLYGFATRQGRELFRQLLTVGQVGPRLALQILSALPPDDLVAAVSEGNVDRLTSIKGIGRKTAQRILIELRDKIAEAGPAAEAILLSSAEETALRALTSKSLGFTPREARSAIEHVRADGLGPEELVRRALEALGR